MRNVLITGIEPFDNEILNPSWEAARALDGERIGDAVLHARQLPCVLATVQQSLLDAIAQVEPDVVLCLGQASGRPDISIERVAINIVDARIPDNAGAQPIDEPVVPGGPVAYFSTLPIKALMRALRQSGIPASISQTAGTYNCNAIFYALEHHIATHRPHVRGGFIHVPYLPEMAVRHPGAPSLALDVLIRAVRIMAETALALSAQQDLKIGAGAVQ